MKNKKYDGGLRSKLKKENKAVNKSSAGAVTLNSSWNASAKSDPSRFSQLYMEHHGIIGSVPD